ncbi:FkbM family methyltransferase [Nocardioides stalactiti]|uniref:FkbM family methyltransferase n=1 Tax=Nocardioides stalactiti TaxID=2755356 RepID=UPI0015FF5963|nr:FkbM family methyltransferase [Nocardioides stalactiti]
MTPTSRTPAPAASAAFDATYRLWSQQLNHRSRRLPRDLVGARVREAFRALCIDVVPALALEVGAHEAGFSRWVRSALPGAHSVAFEANPYVFERYAAEVSGSGVDYRHLAVSDEADGVDLRIPREFHNPRNGRRFRKANDSRMASLAAHRESERDDVVTVPSVRLDDFVASDTDLRPGEEVVAWIDVEGASRQVLTSGTDVLARTALLFIEVERRPQWEEQWLDVDVARFLATCGLVPILRDVQRPGQHNVVYARADLAALPATARLCERTYRRPGREVRAQGPR